MCFILRFFPDAPAGVHLDFALKNPPKKQQNKKTVLLSTSKTNRIQPMFWHLVYSFEKTSHTKYALTLIKLSPSYSK